MTPEQRKRIFNLWALKTTKGLWVDNYIDAWNYLTKEYHYKTLQEIMVLMAKDGITKEEIMEVIE